MIGAEWILKKTLDENWTPFMRAASLNGKSDEKTVLYTKFSKKHMYVLMLAAAGKSGTPESEIVLMQTKLSKKAFEKWTASDAKNRMFGIIKIH